MTSCTICDEVGAAVWVDKEPFPWSIGRRKAACHVLRKKKILRNELTIKVKPQQRIDLKHTVSADVTAPPLSIKGLSDPKLLYWLGAIDLGLDGRQESGGIWRPLGSSRFAVGLDNKKWIVISKLRWNSKASQLLPPFQIIHSFGFSR